VGIVTRTEPLVLHTSSPEETRALAGAVAGICAPGDVLLLAGGLGAGKTTFAQGFGAALGITEPVTSPTFTLVRQYPVPGTDGTGDATTVRTLLHADVWRLEHLHEIVDLGLGELVEDGAVALIEWGDAAEPVLGSDALAVDLAASADDGDGGDPAGDDDRRSLHLAPLGPRWLLRWDALSRALTPWRSVS
jgi:tRNA threonylcarbamoyladenosine biosynthesis protein TsaE